MKYVYPIVPLILLCLLNSCIGEKGRKDDSLLSIFSTDSTMSKVVVCQGFYEGDTISFFVDKCFFKAMVTNTLGMYAGGYNINEPLTFFPVGHYTENWNHNSRLIPLTKESYEWLKDEHQSYLVADNVLSEVGQEDTASIFANYCVLDSLGQYRLHPIRSSSKYNAIRWRLSELGCPISKELLIANDAPHLFSPLEQIIDGYLHRYQRTSMGSYMLSDTISNFGTIYSSLHNLTVCFFRKGSRHLLRIYDNPSCLMYNNDIFMGYVRLSDNLYVAFEQEDNDFDKDIRRTIVEDSELWHNKNTLGNSLYEGFCVETYNELYEYVPPIGWMFINSNMQPIK